MSDKVNASRPSLHAIALSPDNWVPEGSPDPLANHRNGLIGAPVSRVDGPPKVQGAARFAADVAMTDMVYAALAYSTVPKGRLKALDTQAAEDAPGVVLVMTHRNAPRMNTPHELGTAELAACADDLPIMQDDRINWNGQPIALVLADTQEQADHAISLIRATYEIAPAITAFEQARARARTGLQYGSSMKLEIGDAEAALAAARWSVDHTYTTPRNSHNAIEPHAATVGWDGDDLVVHDCPQAVTHVAWSLAEIFGIEAARVHISAPYVGGGFGGKMLWRHQVLAVAAAKLAGRPVRIALSREGVYRVVGGRTTTEQRVAIGAHADGRFSALVHTGTTATTPHNNVPEPFTVPAQCLYAADSFKLEVQVAEIDMVANAFMRGPGEAVGSFALESAIDELADRIGIDPIELRMRNEPATNPTSGALFSSRHLTTAYRMGAERFGWDTRDSHPGTRREGEWLVGLGCATATRPYQRLPGSAARISLTRRGHATVEVAAHEMGMGTATIQTQITAARLGLEPGQVTFAYGESSLPGATPAFGSQQTVAVAGAVVAAQRELVAELLALAGDGSPLAGLTPDEVGCVDGGLCKLDEPQRRESYTSLLTQARRDEVSAAAHAPSPLETTHWSMHSFGAQFCEVRVSAVTGETRVTRFLGAFDCGRILNPKLAASQFRGSIIMGLGLALMEETQFDERTGRIMNPSLAEYHVPVQMDVPQIDVLWTDIPDPHAPMGARGIGEIAITGVAAAVANAVYNATGTRVRDLPITLDTLL